jgi:hypothetical protein
LLRHSSADFGSLFFWAEADVAVAPMVNAAALPERKSRRVICAAFGKFDFIAVSFWLKR